MSFLEQFVVDPPSEKIAAGMNVEGRTLCYHGRSPCILRCGTYFDPLDRKVKVVPKELRLDWLARVTHLSDPAMLQDEDLRRLCGLYRLTEAWNDSYVPTSIKLGLR